MTRPDVQPTKRKALTRREFGLLIIRQDGKCGCGCGAKLDFTKPRQVVDEHLNSLFGGGSNELDNRALYTVNCAKGKTTGDHARHAKIKRLRGETKQNKPISRLSKQHPSYRKPSWPKRRVGQ